MREWLILLQCPGLGVATLLKVCKELNSLTELCYQSEHQLSKMGLSSKQIIFLQQSIKHPPNHLVNTENYIISHKIQLVSIEDKLYPNSLKQTSRPPIVLFAQGNVELLSQPQIAFVGSRAPTAYGIEVTKYLASALVKSGLVVTSGLALGIDGVAHQATIDAGGYTIAVMGSGHANIYPKKHRQLAANIISTNGLLLSEFLPFDTPQSFHFPRRNRVIAGLSYGTVVVEAALKSGSLITAKYALEANRDVFAVPGNIFSPVSTGCHNLIQNGAKLVQCPADILEEYEQLICSDDVNVSYSSSFSNIDKNNLAESQLLASVDHEATSVDVISQRSNLPVDQVLKELLELEILGCINAVPGGYIKVNTNFNNK